MMGPPRLTIGIPTLDRPESLRRAIGSVLAQTTPTRVLVADQGCAEGTVDVMAQYIDHPLVGYYKTKGLAELLWQNWTLCATQCSTEFFAWLQDDDVVAPHFARRVVAAFDTFPRAAVYLARLGISSCTGLANWWQATGPMIPMDLIHGEQIEIKSDLLISGGFFTSFALSPGVAFRNRIEALEAVLRVPNDCDLYAERLVLAELASVGSAVCDPAIVGYWSHHGGNESKRQNAAGLGQAQARACYTRLDELLEGRPGWQDTLGGWALMVGRDPVRHWLNETADLPYHLPKLAEARTMLAQLYAVEGSNADDRPAAPPAPPGPGSDPAPNRYGQRETTTDKRQRRAEKTVKKNP